MEDQKISEAKDDAIFRTKFLKFIGYIPNWGQNDKMNQKFEI